MSDSHDRHQQWAVFWCSLLGPLIYGEIPPEEAGRFLRELTETDHLFPDGQRRKPSRATLWRKWKKYREGGLEALFPKRRSDRGKPRKASQEMIDRAIELKKDQPRRSEETINQFLQQEFHQRLPKSTLYRHLKRAGATRRKLGISREKVRRRWTRDHSNALWLGDFEDGPYVIEGDRAVQTHLSAFIDCHSRYVPDARYYLGEDLGILFDSLLRAWSTHGASRELYLDRAGIYRSHALRAACLALNIRLIHRGAGDPPPGGLIERFFGTVQSQFEAEVRAGDILTLDKLNEAFQAWLEVSYHERCNRETGQPPRLRYEAGRSFTRHVDIQRVVKYFLKREQRTVNKDFSDVQVLGLFFRVDRDLRDDKVEVRYDPFGDLETVLIYSLEGEYLGVGQRHEREEGDLRPPATPQQPKPKHNYLDLLIQKHQQAMRRQSSGVDYRAVLAQAERRWPFTEFAKQLAAHLGSKGGLSAFCTDDLETLQKIYYRLTFLNQTMLEQACARAEQRTIPEIVFHLQQLHNERRT
jgi:transposase InsO family protein